jgi:sugar/nucleoside kinase (ribokinase family)
LSRPYVVCVGLATLDTIFRVPRYPAGDDRVVASQVAVAGGGPAATAAVTLARLGVATFFVGAVGDDDAGAEIRAGLERENVDVSQLAVVPGARSALSTILVGDGTRAIVTVPGPRVTLGAAAVEVCRGAAWVHVDHVGYGAAPRDVRLSIDGGNRIPDLDLAGVALYAPTDASLGDAFSDGIDGALAAGAALVVVTRGAAGCIAATRDGDVLEVPGFPAEAVSTLGAGDVFHGALLAQLVRDVPLPYALSAANTCAALSCAALDGRSAIPSAAELAAVLAQAGS